MIRGESHSPPASPEHVSKMGVASPYRLWVDSGNPLSGFARYGDWAARKAIDDGLATAAPNLGVSSSPL